MNFKKRFRGFLLCKQIMFFCHIRPTSSFLTSLSRRKIYSHLTVLTNNLEAYLSFCSKLLCKMSPYSFFNSINLSLHSLGRRDNSPEFFATLSSLTLKCTISTMLDLKLAASKKQSLSVTINY